MKKFLLVLSLVCAGIVANAQEQESTSLYVKIVDAPAVTALKAKLVELALQNPLLNEYDAKLQINHYEQTKAKAQWLNYLSAAGNLNEYTIKNSSTTGNVFFPRYNFSLMIPIGSLLIIPADVKIKKTEKKEIGAARKVDERKLKADVLDAYELYVAAKKQLELQAPLLEDALAHYKQTEQKFGAAEKGISVVDYNAAYRIYNEELVRKVNLEKELKMAKIEMERLIGVTFEEAVLQSQGQAPIDPNAAATPAKK